MEKSPNLSPYSGAEIPELQVPRPPLQLALGARAGMASQPFGRFAPKGSPPNIQGMARSPEERILLKGMFIPFLEGRQQRCQGPKGSRVSDTGTEI